MATRVPPVVTFTCQYREELPGGKFTDTRSCRTVIEVQAKLGGEQIIQCPRCMTTYEVWVRENRHTRSRVIKEVIAVVPRKQTQDNRHYNMRLRRLDDTEELIQFQVDHEPHPRIDAKSGDPLVFVFGGSQSGSSAWNLHVDGTWLPDLKLLTREHPLRLQDAEGFQSWAAQMKLCMASGPNLLLIANNATGQEGCFAGGPLFRPSSDFIEESKLLTREEQAKAKNELERARAEAGQERQERLQDRKQRRAPDETKCSSSSSPSPARSSTS
jgi:hypothetical protein